MRIVSDTSRFHSFCKCIRAREVGKSLLRVPQRTGIEEHSTRNMPGFVGIRGAHIDNPNLFRIARIGQPLHIGEHFCFRVLVSHVPIIPMT